VNIAVIAIASPKVSARLLRYRFDGYAQARLHVRMAQGRQFLFWPDPLAHLRGGQPVLLEICFADSEESAYTPSQVYAARDGGVWLELFSPRLLREIQAAVASPRRAQRRFATGLLARMVRPGSRASITRISDLGSGGARLMGSSLGWRVGETVLLQEMDTGAQARARVVWSRFGETGVEFDRADPATRQGVSRLVELCAARSRQALELRHPVCCACIRGAPMLDPFLPRAGRRRAEGV